jgi:dienelactone hydrolase
MPVFGLPRPGGRWDVGVADAGSGDRALRIWYPVEPGTAGMAAPYRAGERAATLRTRIRRRLTCSSARTNVPPAPGRHPLLIYVPSWGGTRGENTALAEFLAARGFVVAALDDNDSAAALEFSTPAAVVQTLRNGDAKAIRLAGRVSAELGCLIAGGCGAPQAIRFDPERVGVVGYSFGGAVAAEAARADERIRAAINLDGWMFGTAAARGVPRPYLVIGTGARTCASRTAGRAVTPVARSLEDHFTVENERLIGAGIARYGGYFASIDGTRHAAFSDAGVLLPGLRLAGPLGGRRAHRIIRTLVGQFCDRYVAGRPAPLFAENAPAVTTAETEFDPCLRWIVRHAPRPGNRAARPPAGGVTTVAAYRPDSTGLRRMTAEVQERGIATLDGFLT